MSTTKDIPAAHVQRCRVICGVLGIPECHGSSFVERVRHLFPCIGEAAEREANVQRQAYLIYAAFLGRIPREAETSHFLMRLKDSAPEAVAAFLTQRIARGKGEIAATGALLCPSANTLVIDVTHTLKHPHTSGIQRVVRSLSHSLQCQDSEHLFVRYCKRSHRYVALNELEIRHLTSPQAGATWRRRRAHSWHKVATHTKRWLWRLTGHSPEAGIFFWKHSLLLPEVIAEEGRIAALTVVLTAASTRSTMLLYDLIPVRHPEYFPSGFLSGFIRYLTLLRHIDAISCISNAVRDDVARLLPLVARTKPQPRLGVHCLGADFLVSDRHESPLPTIPTPFVLCVGTIEPRKNQLRIVDAMVQAQARGCQFTGLFIGNAGWLNGEFRDHLNHHAARGHRLVIREHVSDAELESIYRASAFTLYCSLAEGFGLPVIESVMRGKVCITSDRGSMKEIAARVGGCVLVDPEDSDAISMAIQRLVSEPTFLEHYQREIAAAAWPTWHDYTRQLTEFTASTTAPRVPLEARSQLDVWSAMPLTQPTASHV